MSRVRFLWLELLPCPLIGHAFEALLPTQMLRANGG
jgi:hypothetical protein